MTDGVTPLLQGAAAQFQRGDFAGALAASDDALRLAPGHPEALHIKALALGRLGRVDAALPLFDLAANGHAQKHAILANKGNALRAAGRVAESVVAYRSALQADPTFLAAWLSLGLAHRALDEPANAEAAFLRALDVSPGDPKVLNNLGVLFEDQERSAESVEMFSQALRKQPDMLFALVNRGAALRKIGRVDEALADLRKAAALAPGDAETHYQLGSALRQAGLISDAEGAYGMAVAIAPARADIHRDLARMLWEAGRAQEFLAPLDAAIARAPTPELLTLKGEMAYLAGMTGAAESAAAQALTTAPPRPDPYRIIGKVRRRAERYAESVQAFERALEIDPGDFDSRHALAETLLDIGEFDRAVALLDCAPPPEHLQKHIALKTNAMRLTGDEEYRRYYDYDRLTRKMFIDTPPGFADLESFNAALVDAIRPLHASKVRPIDQTLYGGTQSSGRLWDAPHPVIQAMKQSLLKAAAEYVSALPDDPSHPFLARKSARLKCAGAWSVVLSDGGGHVDHIHPQGWISASYYASVPAEVLGSEKQGFLRLGACNAKHRSLPPERWFKPEPGAVIFFPSYMWHGVEPFSSSAPRITAPFDLAPA